MKRNLRRWCHAVDVRVVSIYGAITVCFLLMLTLNQSPISIYGKHSVQLQHQHLLVHFDLKGAAPAVSFFKEVLSLVAANGATGILIEYEDMFPYEGELAVAVNSEAYSLQDLREILGHAKTLGLKVVPFVQSFGHLEWLLKLTQFREYRDHDANIGTLCLTHEKGVDKVVLEALRQVLSFHKEFGRVDFVHIGGDASGEYGSCFGSTADAHKVAIQHLQQTADFVRSIVSHETEVLVWHDLIVQFPHMEVRTLLNSVQMVVRDYGALERFRNGFWSIYASTDSKSLWGASGFKGVDGPVQIVVDLQKRLNNHLSWNDVQLSGAIPRNKFAGLILTGWQRYDHFATLCEILPASLHSLVLNLNVARGHANPFQATSIALNCGEEAKDLDNLMQLLPKCSFTGALVTDIMQKMALMTLQIDSLAQEEEAFAGWLRPSHRKLNFTNPQRMAALKPRLTSFLDSLEFSRDKVLEELSALLIGSAAMEYVHNEINPYLVRVATLLSKVTELGERREFPKRPFNFNIDMSDCL